MILGTVVGVAQSNVKRMLAYSSIAHAGYLLVGLVAASAAGKAAVLFYLVAYAAHQSRRVRRAGGAVHTATGRTRTSATSPGCGTSVRGWRRLLTVFLLSLGGFPPTVGFVAKWYIFNAAIQEHLIALAVLGVLTSVVSVFFYLRDRRADVHGGGPGAGASPAVPTVALAGMVVALVAVLYLGVMPGSLLSIAADSVGSIF